jgi:hypothetical protein
MNPRDGAIAVVEMAVPSSSRAAECDVDVFVYACVAGGRIVKFELLPLP